MTNFTENDMFFFLSLSEKYAHLECDGFSQVLALELRKMNLNPIIECGYVSFRNRKIWHHWIKIDSSILDYRLQMWYGNHAPFGIIDNPDVKYQLFGAVKAQPDIIIEAMKIPIEHIIRKLMIEYS